MVTGCAPFFLLGILGVAIGSWFFGSHAGARFFGLGLLAAFLLYFALLNWTAQARLRDPARRAAGPRAEAPSGPPGEAKLPEEEMDEWLRYLRLEGKILWGAVAGLLAVIAFLAWKP